MRQHVLRPSASASAHLASRSSNRSLRPSDVPAAASAASQKRPSPSPSVKRGKAEKLLKEHGSPPGIRVTAGGRIVPSDLPPLGTSRFGDTTFKPQGLRVTPGNIMSGQPTSNVNGTARIEVVGGQPVVFVGDRMFALPTVNTTNSNMAMGGASVNEPMSKQVPDPTMLTTHGALSGVSYGPPRTDTQTPFAGLDLPTLKAQQALKKQELRSVEQTEVLQASHQSEAWRAGMIEKKRCLIVELDALRKQISAHDTDSNGSVQPNLLGPIGTVPGPASVSSLLPQFPQPLPQAMYAFPAANPYAPMTMYPPSFGAYPGFPATETTPFVPPSTNAPHSPGSGSRRSHAVEIKPPPDETKKPGTSALDPKSPTYEPTFQSTSTSTQHVAPPTPSPPKRSPWREQQKSQPDMRKHHTSSRKLSLSSIDTTDFFPMNTHEHSSTRVAPQTNEGKQSSNENTAVPSTPEKHWPASPWNEDHSGHSRNNEPVPQLSSWPGAFGKPPSLSSVRQGTTNQPFPTVLQREPGTGASASKPVSSNNGVLRTQSDLRTGTEGNWPFSSRAVAHVPGTYQEGYQAGYDHVGMPDSPEVLQGYVQGLLHFLTDEAKKRQVESAARDFYARGIDSRTPSLRGLVARSTPHDSAVSMTYGRNDIQAGAQENIRSANGNPMANDRRVSAYNPRGGLMDLPVSYALPNEAMPDPRQRNASSIEFLTPAGFFSDRISSSVRNGAITCTENESGRRTQEKGFASRVDAFSNGGAPRHTFGNQLQNQNRGYATPLSMQHFYPSPKEMSPSNFEDDDSIPIRSIPHHRLSGLDGAMDDLAEMVNDTHVEDGRTSTGHRSAEAPIPVETEEATASCFKSSSGKGKQKATASPTKPASTTKDKPVSSPVNSPSSPKKSGEYSPAKAKLEHVTNKFRRAKKDDPRNMSPEDRMKRSEKWRKRFQQLKQSEMQEIETHRRNNGA
ncbi:meiotic recombination [Neocucurbitaria cava]|uniref:Meiotic recombination n=1 Tax=Neocucurbitaria cava TaxID=798079 RepID=A0A9W9CK51_9PLEO|nr:meiotic recombination [Neocucurbitaria cava]